MSASHAEFNHHSQVLTGPDTLAGRYMRLFWHPIHRVEDIRPGQAKPIRIMSRDYTLYRGEGGNAYLVSNRCAHRGTQLSVGWVEGEEIRCRYHGWKYSGNGQCTEQPAELDRQFCSRIRLPNWPVRIYKGLIFAWLGDGEAPEFPVYPELEGDGVVEPVTYPRQCNFFNGIDNLFDESHVAFTHRVAFRRILEMPAISYKRVENGAELYSARPGKGVRVRQFLMPNVLRLKIPSDDPEVFWSDYVNWRIPIDDESHLTFGVMYTNVTGELRQRFLERRAKLRELPKPPVEELANTILRGDATIEQVEGALGPRDPYFDVYLEDHVTQVGQGAIADRGYENLGIADVGVRLLRELWTEQLARVARNERVQAWTLPPDVKTASGDIADLAQEATQ